jgi:hypothetical protein
VKHIIRVGRPTHLKVPIKDEDGKVLMYYTACGLVGSATHTGAYDPRDVDCLNCRRTKEFKNKF